jgi:hypothetical protein
MARVLTLEAPMELFLCRCNQISETIWINNMWILPWFSCDFQQALKDVSSEQHICYLHMLFVDNTGIQHYTLFDSTGPRRKHVYAWRRSTGNFCISGLNGLEILMRVHIFLNLCLGAVVLSTSGR